MWPFNRRDRAQELAAARDWHERAVSFSQAIAESVENRALGDAVGGIVSTGLGITETAAGLWGRAFTSAQVVKGDRARALCGPSMFELIGREFVLSGESLFVLDYDGGLTADVASSWEVNGRGVQPIRWRYRADVLGPSGNRTRRADADSVLHFMVNRDPAQPWKGQAAGSRASLARDLAAALETRLGEEAAAHVGNLLAIPRDPGRRVDKDGNEIDPLGEVKKTIAGLKGKTAIVETTQSGWGEGRLAAPRNDWKPERLGANPPQTLAELRRDVAETLAVATGVPSSLLVGQTDGTAQREAWRRFLHGTIAPAGRLVEEELSIKLEEDVSLSFEGLFASDLSGRARAFQSLVQGGLSIEDAAQKAGLMEMDE